MKPFIAPFALIFFLLAHIAPSPAQLAPPGQQIGVDPVWGPICQGPPGYGPGRCEDVQRFLQIDQLASQIQLQPIGFDQAAGPICMGPLGPGPCNLVKHHLAMQQLAAQQFRLQQIGTAPGGQQICMGPLGPGPCDVIRNYLMQQQPGAPPVQSVNPSQPQLINAGNSIQPMCRGPMGPTQCVLVGQMSLDSASGQVPQQLHSAPLLEVILKGQLSSVHDGLASMLPALPVAQDSR